ncbi:MAG: hypothetical protein IH621_11310 [Krumholzibacteria bacterium]|nr:hypothetical protein [Candidatus Krumholzibacteria bacterium]
MRRGWILTIAASALAVAGSLPAQAGGFGLGLSAALPTGDFGDYLDSGFGVHAMYKRPVTPLVQLTADVGWTRFGTADLTGDLGGFDGFAAADDNLDVWNFTGGGKVDFMPFGLGLEYGYFSEIDEYGLVPNVGVSFTKFAVDLRYKATGDANWFEVRAGLYF